MRKVTLSEMLGHPMTRSAVQQLASGMDPRLVAAQAAGTALADHLARQFGVKLPSPRIDSQKNPGPEKTKKTTKIPVVEVVPDGEVIDAEFTVIDVTSGVKRRKKA
jgi:hypothetical protein